MPFLSDQQTLEDLDLLGAFRPQSVYSLFNKVETRGGERLLQKMFQHPLSTPTEINGRSRIFAWFGKMEKTFPFAKETFDGVERYLGTASASYPVVLVSTLRKKLVGVLLRGKEYQQLYEGVLKTIGVLGSLKNFIREMKDDASEPFENERLAIQKILEHPSLAALHFDKARSGMSVMQLARYDHILRHVMYSEMEQLLEAIYRLDVFIAVSRTAKANAFSYATAFPENAAILRATALRHPRLVKGVGNSISMHSDNSLLFLTGANMAGKSTLMKSVGIAVYLAHMGFPVAAGEMAFSVMDGLYSSINVSDNLQQGYSHFYAEVLRVKKVAGEVGSGKHFVVLFDELFKGTNVKDAYDATLSVSEAFAGYRRCFFIISTHITEVGEALGRACGNVEFSYMPTIMEGTMPRYTYLRQPGITNDRQGMLIIDNEKILEMLRD